MSDVEAYGGRLVPDTEPRTTLRALTDQLVSLLAEHPEWADFEVQLGQADGPWPAGWSGRLVPFVAARTFELETEDER